MRKLLTAVLVAAGVVQGAGAAQAQSNISGFSLGVALHGAAIDAEDADEIESGGGLALRLGYGVTDAITLFIEGAGANINPDGADDYPLVHVDLGGRFSFLGSASRLRPFVGASVTGRAASFDLGTETLDLRGRAFTVGGGLEYFVSSVLGLEVGLNYSFGSFDEGRLSDGDWEDLEEEEVDATTTRFNLGIVWRP